jgi:hypothetical protein
MPTPRKNHKLELSEKAERRKKIPVADAAKIVNMSENTFRRHYAHLIKQLSPGIQAVTLGDVLDI